MSKERHTPHLEVYADPHHSTYSKKIFGFWLYLLSDFMLFGTFLATYLVLSPNTFGGPPAHQIFDFDFGLVQSLVLLGAAATSGLGSVAAHRKDKKMTLIFFSITFFLGLIFLGTELVEFNRLIQSGNSWKRSAFLSAFFNLEGMHALHMLFAISWIPVLLLPVYREGITPLTLIRLVCLKMFWQFLNIIWIFIFTMVYLIGRP
ncbi:MAG TPA: cytochrome c oxidase subunit 3 [Rhabdochlamydiaceae bacterium]|nr:cytochrome c oxidase subunit 3 [Rhabdochlamydiaceae bacterium]